MTLELQNLRLSSKKRLYYYLDIEIEGSEFRLLSKSPAIFFVNSTVKPWKSSRYDTLHLSIWPIFELVQWLQLLMSHQSYFLSMVYRLQEDVTENLITGFSFIFRSLQVSLSSFGSLKFTMKSLRFQGKQTMHHFDTENILPWHFPLTSIYTNNYNN